MWHRWHHYINSASRLPLLPKVFWASHIQALFLSIKTHITTTYYLYILPFLKLQEIEITYLKFSWDWLIPIIPIINNKLNVAHLCMTWYLFLFIQNSTHSEYLSLVCSVLLNTITYWRSSGCVKFMVINRDIRNIFVALILNSTDAFIFVRRWLIYVRVRLCLFLSGISEIL